MCVDRTKILSGLFFALVLSFLCMTAASKCFAGVLVQEAEESILADSGAENQENAVPEVPMVEKRTEGMVTGVSAQGLAVEYALTAESSKEIWIDFGNEISYRGMSDKSELVVGDVVQVIYGETPDAKKFVKEIIMVKKAPPAVEEEATE